MTDLPAFTASILDQIRLRKLDASQVNPAIAKTLREQGLIGALEAKSDQPAGEVALRTGHYRWRITDAGLVALGKPRIW